MVALFMQKVENDMRILKDTSNSAEKKKPHEMRTPQERLTYQNMWDTHKVHIMYIPMHL
jgi:hypothetical protein